MLIATYNLRNLEQSQPSRGILYTALPNGAHVYEFCQQDSGNVVTRKKQRKQRETKLQRLVRAMTEQMEVQMADYILQNMGSSGRQKERWQISMQEILNPMPQV